MRAAAATGLADRLDELAATLGDEPAVIGLDQRTGTTTLSWTELAAGVRRTADRLAGVTGVVAVAAANTPDAVTLLLGTLAAELPLLVLDPRAPAGERETLVRFVARDHGTVTLLSGDAVTVAATGDREPPRGVGYLLATGGSSGIAKVVAAPGPVRYDPRRFPSPVLRRAGWRSGQRQLVAGPLHHTAPFTASLDGLLDGNTVVLLPTFAPDLLVDAIREQRVGWVQLTPAHMRSVVQLAEPARDDLASLHAVLHTAAAVDVATKKAWLDLVGAERVWESYGSTEEIGVTLVRGDEWLARPGTVGKGYLTQIRILDDAGRRLPPGEVGTVYMRTGRMAARARYLGGLSMPTTPDGFASVGDAGWLDEDGYLFLAPRRTDLINVGGENVYPAEVEAALLEHPAVLDAVVLGRPDPIFGAVVQARVVARGADRPPPQDLIRHCSDRLSPYKVPRVVTYVPSVPRTAAGKLERWRMREDG